MLDSHMSRTKSLGKAKFEEEQGEYDKACGVFQTALQFLGNEEEQIKKAQVVFNAFAKMEVCSKDYNCACVIYMVCS